MGLFYRVFIIGLIGVCVQVCAQTWNSPYVSSKDKNVSYLAFTNPPKTLDPARSYSSDEVQFTAQIYEPPLQYHYLKRPYTLMPLSAAQMPIIRYLNAQGQPLPDNADPKIIADTIYEIAIQPGIFYQPHPAFAKDAKGRFFYLSLNRAQASQFHTLADFKYQATRELVAADFVYEIKRLADPAVQSPIYGLMSQYIVGLPALARTLRNAERKINLSEQKIGYIDLRQYPLEGATVIDRYHYQIKIHGFYPQFKFWLAMPFFAPIPWEVVYFYSQPGMIERNISLDWYPVGTGPYLLAENNPNREMVLQRNPNFHQEFYPTEGEPDDAAKGYLKNSGKQLPLIDRFVFSLDKENIPRWNKFLQGYYDRSEVDSDSFAQAIHIEADGSVHLTPLLQKKQIRLSRLVAPAIYYIGFNMLDPVVGGDEESHRQLRRAVAIAIHEEEFINIFLNGRGIPAQGPIPPGIFGYQTGEAGIDPWVYTWNGQQAQRRPLAQAKALLVAAGYPNGRDPKTGLPLMLNYDLVSNGGPDENAQYNWYRKQLAKLGIELNIRATLYSRFQDKMRAGAVQIFSWGWLADYPDPENFLFLLYGPNGKVKFGGENAANYINPEADQLFTEIAALSDGDVRQEKINQFLAIVRRDGPWLWGFNPINFIFTQVWMSPAKPNAVAYNTLKYLSLDAQQREKLRRQWNRPITWPLWLFLGLLVILSVPLIITYWMRERRPVVKRF
jgi:peptide/nickel transport system substrate-binding protein